MTVGREIVSTLAHTPGMTEKAARLLLTTAPVAGKEQAIKPPAAWLADELVAQFLSPVEEAAVEKLVKEDPDLIDDAEEDAIHRRAQYRSERLATADKKRLEEIEEEWEPKRKETNKEEILVADVPRRILPNAWGCLSQSNSPEMNHDWFNNE